MSKSEKQVGDTDSLAKANAEIQDEIQARADAKLPKGSITLVNLQANPMSVLGLDSYGEVVVTELQMADPRFAGKVERARLLGLIKVK